MEESYETFEEELGPSRSEPPPQKPLRQIHRSEMYPTRRVKEESAPVLQQHPPQVPKTLPRELSFSRPMSLRKSLSIQNLSQIDTPWENVTLNRCLFVAITILVLTSGFQRLHETLRGQRMTEDEDAGLVVRRSGALRHRTKPPEPETSLWEVVFWWMPDLDDDDEEAGDDRGRKAGKSKRSKAERASRGLRNRPPPDKLTKGRGGKLQDRRAEKRRGEEVRATKRRREPRGEVQEMKQEEEEVTTPTNNKSLMEKKVKKLTHKA